MDNNVFYSIFETKMGFCCIAGNSRYIYHVILPEKSTSEIRKKILTAFPKATYDDLCRTDIQKLIQKYFQGRKVDFDSVKIRLDNLPQFTKTILNACRKITYGKTCTYSDLAEIAGRHNAARPTGSALAKNPVPLIIPCHRIIRSDGKTGGFSAGQGPAFKKKMLEMEKSTNFHPL